jgi:hypothetical protein
LAFQMNPTFTLQFNWFHSPIIDRMKSTQKQIKHSTLFGIFWRCVSFPHISSIKFPFKSIQIKSNRISKWLDYCNDIWYVYSYVQLAISSEISTIDNFFPQEEGDKSLLQSHTLSKINPQIQLTKWANYHLTNVGINIFDFNRDFQVSYNIMM